MSVTSIHDKQLQMAALIEQGNLKEGLKLFETFKDDPEHGIFHTRITRLVEWLKPYQGTSEWERRSKEIGTICREYVDKVCVHQSPPHKLAFISTKESYNCFHYPVIFVIQTHFCTALIEDEINFTFLHDTLIPAFHAYNTIGCLEPLKKALQVCQTHGISQSTLMLELVEKHPSCLKDPIGSLLPEKDFPGCFDLEKLQKRIMTDVIPHWMNIKKRLESIKKKEMKDKDKEVGDKTGSTDKSVNFANSEKAFESVNPKFRLLFECAYKRATNKFSKQFDYLKILNKFEGTQFTSFEKFSSLIEFALSFFEQVKKMLIFLRDLELFQFTYDMKKLEMEWQALKSKNLGMAFDEFLANKVKVEITDMLEGPACQKKIALSLKTVSLCRTDAFLEKYYRTLKLFIESCNHDILMYSALFSLPIQIGRNLGIKDEWEVDFPSDEPKADGKEKKESKSSESPFSRPRVPPLSRLSPMTLPVASASLRSSPITVPMVPPIIRTSPITVPASITSLILNAFQAPICDLTNKAANRAFQNGRLHIENLAALLERLSLNPENVFPVFALLGAALSTAIEQLEKSWLLERGVPFSKTTHNLLSLSANIPFLEFSDVPFLRDVNFAERNIRNIVETSPGARTSSFQRALRQAQLTPSLKSNLERIRTVLLRTFPLLLKLVNRGEPKEMDLEDTVQKVMDRIQEPVTIAQLPPRHPEIALLLESLQKHFSVLPVNDANRSKLTNLLQNLLVRLKEEARVHPSPEGMRVHYGPLFRFIPLIAEELIKLLFMKREVETNPVDFMHDLLEMLDAAKVPLKDLKARIVEFLKRIPEYAQMERYPVKAKYKSEKVNFIAECIRKVQGKSPNPLDQGFTPAKGSYDEAFVALDKELFQEFQLLEEFVIFIGKLL